MEGVSISIPWAEAKKEFEWIDVGQGESYARSYLLKHPETIATGLEFLGVEVVIPDGTRLDSFGHPKVWLADVLFRKGNCYYVVETEESVNLESKGRMEAERNAKCLDEHLLERGISAEIIPVFAGVEFLFKKPEVGSKLSP